MGAQVTAPPGHLTPRRLRRPPQEKDPQVAQVKGPLGVWWPPFTDFQREIQDVVAAATRRNNPAGHNRPVLPTIPAGMATRV